LHKALYLVKSLVEAFSVSVGFNQVIYAANLHFLSVDGQKKSLLLPMHI